MKGRIHMEPDFDEMPEGFLVALSGPAEPPV